MRKFVYLTFLVASFCSAQTVPNVMPDVSAGLTLEKNVYSAGEPIVLTFTARFTGTLPSIDLHSANPYGCGSSYRIEVTPDNSGKEPASGPSCGPLFIWSGSCLFGSVRLRKGELVTERILLNRFGDFSSPGNYVVHVARDVGLSALSKRSGTSDGKVIRTFALSVGPSLSLDGIRQVFAPYIAGLQSESYERRRDAATVIGALPTLFLQPDLIRLLERNQFPEDAIRGLRRLNSEESRAALFRFVSATGSSDSMRLADARRAIQALAAMGDAEYSPQLIALMKRTSDVNQKGTLFNAAARLDPKRTLAIIGRYLHSPDDKEREIGVTAMAATEQPEALPVLVGMLNDASVGVRASAAAGLMSLTRESPTGSAQYWPGKDPASAAPFWIEWLKKNPSLPVHLLRECPQGADQQ